MMDSIKLNWIGSSPVNVMELVKDADVYAPDSMYVAGSQGQYKNVKEYDSDNNLLKTTTFFYQELSFPTTVTRTEVI